MPGSSRHGRPLRDLFSANAIRMATRRSWTPSICCQRWNSKCRSFAPTARFRRINRTAAAGPVEVEAQLFALLELAMRMCRETGGAYDITSAPLWEVWGFARRAGAVPDPQQLAEAQRRVGGQLVELDGPRRTVRFLREGVKLNLGSIGKGYAADRCGQLLRRGRHPRFSGQCRRQQRVGPWRFVAGHTRP